MTKQAPRFVYVIQSVVDRERHYVGLTSDVAARITAHNEGRSLHSAKHKPWRLMVAVEFADAAAAAAFERYLKSGSGRAFARRHFGSTGE